MHQKNHARSIEVSALKIAMNAAFEAGKYLIRKQGKIQVIYEKSIRDDLLDADLQAEVIILQKLRKNFPAFGILSEEAGKENENAPYQWIVDPLDGSTNFQHGSPLFAVSIALLFNKAALLGVIYLPAFNEMFTAIRGCGALLNNRTIFTSYISTLSKSIIHVGDFAKSGDQKENKARIATIAKLADQVRRVRMIGTAATDLAYIASGRADALIMHSNHPWDIEAGHLILTEAGGNASIFQRGSERAVFIYSNGYIHHQLTEIFSLPDATQPQT
jgi:myo-inositol-1(or 4)-monophosphatase